MTLIKTVILVFLSLLTIIKCLIFNKKRAHYFIMKSKNGDLIDQRSMTYIDEKNINNSLNLVRSDNFKNSLRLYIKYKNVIFFNYFLHLNLIFNKKYKFDSYQYLIEKIFTHIRVTEFYSIDDYRNLNFFSEICKKNSIKFFIYQHGRISNELSFQRNISKIEFHRYYVWSKYFKKKLLAFNNSFLEKNIKIKKRFKFYSHNKISNINNILIIHENEMSLVFIKRLINNLKKNPRLNISYKFRPNDNINYEILFFLNSQNVQYFKNEDIYQLFKKKKFLCLIGINSTLLLEASYFNIFPIQLIKKTKTTYFKDYIKDDVVFYSELKYILFKINEIKKNKKKLFKIKNKIWY